MAELTRNARRPARLPVEGGRCLRRRGRWPSPWPARSTASGGARLLFCFCHGRALAYLSRPCDDFLFGSMRGVVTRAGRDGAGYAETMDRKRENGIVIRGRANVCNWERTATRVGDWWGVGRESNGLVPRMKIVGTWRARVCCCCCCCWFDGKRAGPAVRRPALSKRALGPHSRPSRRRRRAPESTFALQPLVFLCHLTHSLTLRARRLSLTLRLRCSFQYHISPPRSTRPLRKLSATRDSSEPRDHGGDARTW